MCVEWNIDDQRFRVLVVYIDRYAEYKVDSTFIMAVSAEANVVLPVAVFPRGGWNVPSLCWIGVERAVGGSSQERGAFEGVEDDEIVGLVFAVSGVAKYLARS